jgi:hypothetical protein
MPVLNNAQDILSAFGIPAFKITFLSVGRQIHETTLAALQTGKRLSHHFLSSPLLTIQVSQNVMSNQGAAMIKILDGVRSGY